MSFTVTVYSKPSCVQCNATYRALDNKGINYQVIDVTADDAAAEYVKGLGYMQAPVVVTDDEYWSRLSTRQDRSALAATH